MAKTSASADTKDLSFEAAMGELESIVRQLEGGAFDLDKSVALYERGVSLKIHCEARLKDAAMKIEKISIAADGSVSTTPFSATE